MQVYALSCNSLPDKDDSVAMPSWTVVAPIEVVSLAKEGEEALSGRQFADPEIEIIIRFLKEGVLPENNLKVREVTLAKAQYKVIDGVLYHVEQDKTLHCLL